MSEPFKPIESQEELENILKSRLARQKEGYEEKLKDYDQLKSRSNELENENISLHKTIDENSKKYEEYDKDMEALNSKISEYETSSLKTKIALSHGLPIDLADRLQGSDEESLTADAERMAGFMVNKMPVPPLKTNENESGNTNPLRQMLENMSDEGE